MFNNGIFDVRIFPIIIKYLLVVFIFYFMQYWSAILLHSFSALSTKNYIKNILFLFCFWGGLLGRFFPGLAIFRVICLADPQVGFSGLSISGECYL